MTENNPDAERLIALLAARDVATETLNEAEWECLIALAQRHNVAPVLYARLKKRGITLPPAIAEQLRQNYLVSATRNLHLFQELGKILRALQAADIPVIPLKGACLAEAVYGNIALRPMGDVDLLVKPDDLAKALAVLCTLGYVAANPFEIESVRQVSNHMPPLSKRGGVTLEIHWTIVNPRNNVHFDDNDLDQVWSRAMPVKIGGGQVLMLSPMDLLWHLCLHASVHHRFDGAGLRNYLDIALVIQQYGDAMDWTQFTACANQWGIANGVRLALQLTEEWTGVVIPSPVLAALQTALLDDATIDWVRHKILNGSSLALKSDVARFEGKARIADKVAAIRDVLFPSRTVMASKYHALADSWRILFYYPVRFKDLWMRYSQAMWQLLRRDRTLTTEARQEARLREYLGWN
jgi:hypothetical protein